MQIARDGNVVDVMPGRVRQRPRLTPAGHPAINQLGIVGEQHIWPQPHPFHYAGAIAFKNPIG